MVRFSSPGKEVFAIVTEPGLLWGVKEEESITG